MSPIEGGTSQISGGFTVEEAQDLANMLKIGKLPAPAKIVQEQTVGPTLGSRSDQGWYDGIWPFIYCHLHPDAGLL